MDIETRGPAPALSLPRLARARRGDGERRARASRAPWRRPRTCTSRSSPGLVVGGGGPRDRCSSSPVILALLAFGLFSRNDERGYDLLNVNLAPVGAAALHRALRDHGREPAAVRRWPRGGVAARLVAARFAGKFVGRARGGARSAGCACARPRASGSRCCRCRAWRCCCSTTSRGSTRTSRDVSAMFLAAI